MTGPAFLGETVNHAMVDPRDGRTVLANGSGWQFVSVVGFRDAGEGRRPELIDNANRPVGASLAAAPNLQLHLDMALTKFRVPGFLEGNLAEASAREPADAPEYAGPAACASCHPSAHASWSGSRHALSTKTVRAKNFDSVWLCLSCHSTAPGKRGGYGKQGDEQGAVTCEACHGPGAAHVAAKGRSPLAKARESCARCHIPEMSPGFSFEVAWPKMLHGK